MSGENRQEAADKLRALQRELVEEILTMPDDMVLAEAKEDRIDPAEATQELRSRAMTLVTQARKKRLTEARRYFEATTSPRRRTKRPPIDMIKRRVQALFATAEDLSLAFRKGERQSDADWESLWDDLLEMGLIHEGDAQD